MMQALNTQTFLSWSANLTIRIRRGRLQAHLEIDSEYNVKLEAAVGTHTMTGTLRG
jgi:hypothetical protein